MKEAEKIASRNGFEKIAVISSIGTRNYYRKLGYELEGLYMTKKIEYTSILSYLPILFLFLSAYTIVKDLLCCFSH